MDHELPADANFARQLCTGQFRHVVLEHSDEQLRRLGGISHSYSIEPPLELVNVALGELSDCSSHITSSLVRHAPGSSGSGISGTEWFAFSWHSLFAAHT